ncbi:LOW QUALITY PROTEIN: Hypothetical protein PHPALM_17042 [Phytophthora palmivora]|uniref:Chromo domain-containing protein n=1 Tax=Phytophthora palmivora TaxID=4796 RepID=A0A2P4XN90_9STRA|nr:LOW QUALITY PROTEIN: Hypothetical protein PHPALM_17042 [Phytophthora palmivora]
MNKEVTDAKEKKRLQGMARHKGIPANFDVGDYVLWTNDCQTTSSLISGPFKIVKANPHSFLIQHLVSGREYDVHTSRFKFYADEQLNTNPELLEFASNQGAMLGVEGFSDRRFNETFDRWELFVSWTGLQDIESSWEPLTTLLQDVPTKVQEHVMESGDNTLRSQLR